MLVDDERPARTKLRRYLADEDGIEVAGEADCGRAAIDVIRRLRPDLVFLDVQMPDMDGFAVVEALGSEAPAIVFVTAHDEFALRAFEVHAMSYLLKPVSPARFHETLSRIRGRIERGDRVADSRAGEPFAERILVPDGDRSVFVRVEGIDRIEADRNYVVVHAGTAEYRMRATIESIAARLDPSRFLRANRSTVVRLDAVVEVQPWFHGEYRLRMSDGAEVMWTRTFIDRAPASVLGLNR
ncbi:MAG: response regulator transcription factor [Blastocatellia bacterium]|nr:response regulator transcription factor [Blastocatellia bacterium]